MHHPAVLAKRAATVDHISGGRLVLGIGAGWQVNEHRAYGIDLLPLGERVSRFSEALQIVRGLLLESRTTFAGQHLTVIDAPCEPKPLQQPLPILVGAAGPRMLRATARWADEWNTWGDLDQAAQRHGLLVAACEAVGRDMATLRRSVQAMIFLTDDRARDEEHAPSGRSLVGSPGEVVDAFGRYAELGFDEFIVPDFNLGATPTARREALERIREDVLAQL